MMNNLNSILGNEALMSMMMSQIMSAAKEEENKEPEKTPAQLRAEAIDKKIEAVSEALKNAKSVKFQAKKIDDGFVVSESTKTITNLILELQRLNQKKAELVMAMDEGPADPPPQYIDHNGYTYKLDDRFVGPGQEDDSEKKLKKIVMATIAAIAAYKLS